MLAIHNCHRKLAELTYLNLRKDGSLVLGNVEIALLVKHLKENYALIQRLDELKQLSFQAHLIGDLDWQMDLCRQIEEIEVQCL
ncbi:hypothetical protein WMW72_35195 [Paenibacillus filicis]|uniref:Uncharacterized protein n=1 Tax=Paenibacillus filicis TaxID=669464 RepID=A0ABU9DZB8_9BACL